MLLAIDIGNTNIVIGCIKDDEILLYRVRDIDTSRNLWQRLFGVGTVVVMSSDKSMPSLVLKNIKNYADLILLSCMVLQKNMVS